MNIQRVKLGAKITLYNGIYMILLGILEIFFLDYVMKQNFNAIDQLWGFFTRYNSDIAKIFNLQATIIGILLISQGIVIIFLSYFIIKRKDKMAWIILFLTGMISWAGLLIISILLKNLLLMGSMLLGWLSFIMGMLYPILYYLEKSYREY